MSFYLKDVEGEPVKASDRGYTSQRVADDYAGLPTVGIACSSKSELLINITLLK